MWSSAQVRLQFTTNNLCFFKFVVTVFRAMSNLLISWEEKKGRIEEGWETREGVGVKRGCWENENSKSYLFLGREVSLGDFSSIRHSYGSVLCFCSMVHHACLKCYVLEPQMLTVRQVGYNVWSRCILNLSTYQIINVSTFFALSCPDSSLSL